MSALQTHTRQGGGCR